MSGSYNLLSQGDHGMCFCIHQLFILCCICSTSLPLLWVDVIWYSVYRPLHHGCGNGLPTLTQGQLLAGKSNNEENWVRLITIWLC